MVGPSIEGSYHLIRRELPDGTTQYPPDVNGMITFTKEFRNFSVLWKDEDDRFHSECYVARYNLTDTEYSETPEYLIVDGGTGGEGIRHDLSKTTASTPVARDREHISLALPQPFEKALDITVEFDGAGMKATGKDLFTDYWERVR